MMHSGARALIYVTRPEGAEDVLLIQVEGDLRTVDAPRFQRWLNYAAEADAHGVVLDLRGCRFLDGECASALAEAAQAIHERGGSPLQIVTSVESVLDLALKGAWRSKLWIHHSLGSALADVAAA
jgi:anti-anti-sigma factor